MRKKLFETLYFCLGLLLVGIIIEIVCLKVNKIDIFPHITTDIKDFFILLGDKKTYIYSGNTILHLIESIIAAGFFGITFGVLAGLRKTLYSVFKPLMAILRCLPIIVLIYILMLSVGFKNAPIVATSLVLFPLIYEGVYQGVVTLDKNLTEAYRLDSNFCPKVLFRVYLPLISSHCKSVFISAIGMGIKVLITTEYLCGIKNTLGGAVQSSWQFFEYEYLYAYTILMVILTLILEGIPYFLIWLYGRIQEYRHPVIKE